MKYSSREIIAGLAETEGVKWASAYCLVVSNG